MEPIKIGESSDATASEKKLMKNRAYVLHSKLKKIIDRKDLSELAKYLKPKREFVVSIKMTDFQQFMYKKFLSRLNESDSRLKVRTYRNVWVCMHVRMYVHISTHIHTYLHLPIHAHIFTHTHLP
jgi:SNF2 family DNA or RNA helicase